MYVKDGWLAGVNSHKFAKPLPAAGKIQTMLSKVVGEVGQAGIFPAFF